MNDKILQMFFEQERWTYAEAHKADGYLHFSAF